MNSIFITVSEQTASWCYRAADMCGKMAGINHLDVQTYPWPNNPYMTKYKIYRADVKNLTLALRLYKVAHGNIGCFYSIDCAVQELEDKWEKGRPGHDKKRMSRGSGEEIQINDGTVQVRVP